MGSHLVSEDEIVHVRIGITHGRKVYIVAAVFTKCPVAKHAEQVLFKGHVPVQAQVTGPRGHLARVLGVATTQGFVQFGNENGVRGRQEILCSRHSAHVRNVLGEPQILQQAVLQVQASRDVGVACQVFYAHIGIIKGVGNGHTTRTRVVV